ncbi:GLPGLI family protein [Frigoriflavimonas asaccharolytica]|uniref:GLPGLI family protein n=1 Tax=Frigoriflavimonas asaccharolytica TaxID=2735899 RepID=A0A8J8K6D3_9FLAO|nr:GLPGLI family protein [Frigoriflavimonas asaccharolytica]NRS93615.1 GLPGLI family protein [Frigoriflavimonas asaccharolytica]
MRTYLIFVIFFSALVNAQNFKVFFELKYQPQEKNDSIKKSEIMVLNVDIVKKTTTFFNYNAIKSDSIYVLINNSSQIQREQLLNIAPEQSFFFNIKKNIGGSDIEHTERFNTENYVYDQRLVHNWKLLDISKNILGHYCKAATVNFAGRLWTAWYTLDIPIPEGPYKFHGLPGFILNVESADNEYKFEAISISKELYPLTDSKNVIKVKNENFLRNLKKKYIKDPSGKSRLEDLSYGFSGSSIVNGVKYSSEDSYKLLNKELRDWMKTHNNPIEKNDIWVR